MSKEKIYPDGVMCFGPGGKSPDFVLGTVIMTPKALITWFKENAEHLTEYNGNKQYKFQLLSGNKGPYMVLDTFVPSKSEPEDVEESVGDDFPF